MLTATFSKVLQEIEILSDAEQNAIAAIISEELKWTNAFVKSQNLLSQMAGVALSEFRRGKTKPVVCK
jgi:hypothetical protein